MAFKVKDLLITVLPAENKADAAAGVCPGCTLNITNYTNDCCHGCSVTYTGGRSCFCQIAHPEDLAILKEQLKQALVDIETRERDIKKAMRPKTLSEVEELEEKLTAALAEIKGQKTKLMKAAPAKGKQPKPRAGGGK